MNRWHALAAASAVLFVSVQPTLARHHHRSDRHQADRHHRSSHHIQTVRRQQVLIAVDPDGCVSDNNGRRRCLSPSRAAKAPVYDANGSRVAYASVNTSTNARGYNGTIIGGRPDGCPHAYCGCGLRKYLGLDDKRLNLAWNWARFFPRVAGPAPGMAAVRGHHVMYIEAAAGDGLWTVRDYNSGHGLSRVHVRDVRGYVFVNPRG